MSIFKALSKGNGKISETNITSFINYFLASTNELKTTLILLQIIILTGCSSIRNTMTFYPDKENEIPKKNIPSYVSEKKIKTPDKETIQTFYFHHPDSSDHSLVIYFHGNAGNLYGRFGYANKLYEMNQNVLLVSYRGYAKSTGKPSEKGIYIDGESAVAFANDSLGYSEKDITIIGRSLGTTVAVHSSQKKNLKGVILITPLTSGSEMAIAMGMESLTSVTGDSYNSLGKINNLNSPILIIHGTDDEVVPYYMGESLFKAYNGEKSFITVKRGNHNNLQNINPELFWGEIEKIVTKSDNTGYNK